MIKLFSVGLLKLLFVIIPLMLIGIVILPFILLGISREREDLPYVFRLWDNFSGPVVDGLAGDYPFRVEKGMGITITELGDAPGGSVVKGYPTNPFWSNTKYYAETCGFWKLWWRRYVWLAWRNPVDYTKGVILGADITGRKMTRLYKEKSYLNVVQFDGSIEYKEIYWVSDPWFKTYRHRLRVGYKCDNENNIQYQSSHLSNRKFLRFEFSYSPFAINR